MGLLFVLLIAIPSVWITISTTKKVTYARNMKLWFAFLILAVIGMVLGLLWTNWQYHIGSKMRIQGFPMPLVFFHFEDNQWIDFPLPLYVSWPGFLANIVAGVAVCFLPFRFFIKTKK
jgi:hypothetical protein